MTISKGELSNHVCSLEWARKLKEVGVKQESVFYYNSETMKLQKGFTSHIDEQGKMKWSISAFLSSEILERLPHTIGENYLQIYKDEKGIFNVGYDYRYNPDKIQTSIGWFTDGNFVNCLSEMLHYLIVNKLLKI